MRVEHLMTPDVQTCKPLDSLSTAANIMASRDCGFVPVTEERSARLAGVITDRDICVAAATKHCPTDLIPVGEVMNTHIVTCLPTDEIRVAIDRMVEGQVRRLPVVDKNGCLKGILSLNDLALSAEMIEKRDADDVTYADVVKVLKAVSAHRLPRIIAAA